ncbi:helix-turn-helix domain-containing protein [Burkholderia cepacia]|uniref:helix-turn-helix domain-containing protein n=1 Tax=Burkholderia cepacia TaxID=292 RepID=UPI001CF0EBF8|nr:helix-turn-helix domain-containing protein [Burkholderia cepacia]MCA8060691.1 helix-turn-helix domain-containing protein [Burkholderia cepacia]
MENWGERLKAERERLGYSQAKFGEACGVGRTAQFNYERGEREPGLSYMKAAEALGVDAFYVFSGTRKDDDWLYARAYKRVLDGIRGQFELDRNQMSEVVQLAVDLEKSEKNQGSALRIGRLNTAIQAWLKTSARPDQFIDLGLLATIIQHVDGAKEQHPTLPATKQAYVVSTLYRAFKASGKVDEALITETVALAAK